MKRTVSEVVSDHMQAWGGRRFLVTVGAGLVDAVLLWAGKLSDGGYVTVTLATVAVYIGANTYQKREQIKAGNTDPDQTKGEQ